MSETLTIALLSDIHAHSAEKVRTPSFFDCSIPERDHLRHPGTALKKLINDECLKADLLICGGDLADCANPTALTAVWRCLGEIKTELKASHLYATAGNHDLDSRHKHNSFDARGHLLGLDPLFPCEDFFLSNEYWARNVAVVEETNYRLVLLNSAAYHGYKDEYIHGRVSEQTRCYLKSKLGEKGVKTINLLLCHHPPGLHSEYGLGEADRMKDGELLLKDLKDANVGPWLVLHGHKHHPKIFRSEWGGGGPMVFSMGSLTATLYAEILPYSANQFYIIEIDLKDIQRYGLVGTFRAWNWNLGSGFLPGHPPGLPKCGGFGYTTTPELLSDLVMPHVTTLAMPFADIVGKVPQLKYVSPSDLTDLGKHLERHRNATITFDSYGQPHEIGRIP